MSMCVYTCRIGKTKNPDRKAAGFQMCGNPDKACRECHQYVQICKAGIKCPYNGTECVGGSPVTATVKRGVNFEQTMAMAGHILPPGATMESTLKRLKQERQSRRFRHKGRFPEFHGISDEELAALEKALPGMGARGEIQVLKTAYKATEEEMLEILRNMEG